MALSNDEFVSTDSVTDDADKRLPVKFSIEAKLDAQNSSAEKLAYKDREYITILIPGDKTLDIHRPVMPSDRIRFSSQYAAWKASKAGGAEVLTGTPLGNWPGVTEAQRKELAYFNVFTVEQLSNISDGYAANMMGIHALKEMAKRYVAAATSSAPLVAMQAEINKRDEKIAGMEIQLAEILKHINKSEPTEAPVKKGK